MTTNTSSALKWNGCSRLTTSPLFQGGESLVRVARKWHQRPITTPAPSAGAGNAVPPAADTSRSPAGTTPATHPIAQDRRADTASSPAADRGNRRVQAGPPGGGIGVVHRDQFNPNAFIDAIIGSEKNTGSTRSTMSPDTSRKFRLFSSGTNARRAPLSIPTCKGSARVRTALMLP